MLAVGPPPFLATIRPARNHGFESESNSVPLLNPWPFAIVPDPGRAKAWAGRTAQRAQIQSLLGRWQRRNASEINVLWADFGQGKTHSLMYIQNKLSESNSLSHYVQLPPLTSGSPFVALYRQVLHDFPLERLAQKVFEHFRNNPMGLFQFGLPAERCIYQLLWIIATRAPGNDLAVQWLQGQPAAAARTLTIGGRSVSLIGPPNSAQNCQNLLDTLLSVSTNFPPGRNSQFVLLIDEFQRVAGVTDRRRVEVCDAIHLIFNRHPTHLRLVLAFAGALPEIISEVLTPDLQSRVGSRIGFPPLTLDEGRSYLAELLAQYRTEGSGDKASPYYPFASEAVDLLLHTADPSGESLSLRKINKAFDSAANVVLDARDSGGGNGDAVITVAEVRDCLPKIRGELANDSDD